MINSFDVPKAAQFKWITFLKTEFYPDFLEEARIKYIPILEQFGKLLGNCNTSQELFLTIAKEPPKIQVQLVRIFRRYVAPVLSVEMTRRRTKAEQIVSDFGNRFRKIEQVKELFAARPLEDEALMALLYEYQKRGQKGYALTGLFFKWFNENLGNKFNIRGPIGAGPDLYLPNIIQGYPTNTPIDFAITEMMGPLRIIGFARYDSDRGGSQEDDRTGVYNRNMNEILSFAENNNMNLKLLFVNDGPGLLLGSMWDDYAHLEKGSEDKVMVCTLKMLDSRLTEEWIKS